MQTTKQPHFLMTSHDFPKITLVENNEVSLDSNFWKSGNNISFSNCEFQER